MADYNPEIYWDRVGQEVKKRRQKSYSAGDEDPYIRYQGQKFVKNLFYGYDFQSKTILDIGCGLGNNLRNIVQFKPKKVFGVDISQTMLDIAAQRLAPYKNIVQLFKIDGENLPFEDESVDVSFTVTVLQHVTDERMFRNLVREICRVTKTEIVLFEDIGDSLQLGIHGRDWIGRQISVYKSLFADYGFKMDKPVFLNVKISEAWHHFIFHGLYIRFINKRHKEGEPINFIFRLLIGLPLFVTRYLDDIFVEQRNMAKMVFHRQ